MLASSADLRLSVVFADPAVVAIAGELDLVSAPELTAVLDALAARGHDRIIVECEELSFIDASGLGAFAAAQARLGASAGEIRVQGLSASAYRVFEITDMVGELRARRQDPGSLAELDHRDTDQLAAHAFRLVAESDRANVLSALLSLAPKLLVNCDGASVTLRRGEHMITAAASDETVRHLDGVQYERLDGPCVDASLEGLQIHSPSLVDEQRWRDFTTEALERGMESVLSSPLSLGDGPSGALNLYSRTRAAFAAEDREHASLFASIAALLVHASDETTALKLDARIHDALDSRDVIAQSQGIIMERLGVDAQDAYETLRRESVSTSVPMRVRADELVEEAQNRGAAPDPGPTDG